MMAELICYVRIIFEPLRICLELLKFGTSLLFCLECCLHIPETIGGHISDHTSHAHSNRVTMNSLMFLQLVEHI